MEMEQAFEIKRLFLGDVPLLFYVEIAFRTFVMYAYALLMLRLIGKRAQNQLSLFEFAIVIAMGSAVGDPMFYPQVPLLHGMVVITVIVGINKVLEVLIKNFESMEKFVEGSPVLMARDGYLSDTQHGSKGIMSREELFAILRTNKVEQLGQVKRAYMEQSGHISVFVYDGPDVKPGLPIIPPWDIAEWPMFEVEAPVRETGPYACWTCGYTKTYEVDEIFGCCPHCESEQWTLATKEPLKVVLSEG